LRLAVAVVLVLCGAGIVAGSIVRASFGWPLLCTVGGVLVAAAGVFTVVRGSRWPGMGSRYERRGTPREDVPLWDALDRGDDPTAG
jgi:hypothetical protein